VTPAVISVSVDPNAFASQKGTVSASLTIASPAAVNLPQPVRLLINSEQPSQRGTFVDVPGKVVDILPDPRRGVYYVLRQDKNRVLVFDETNNTQKAVLRTCTTPRGMTITFDQQDLLVGCDNSHIMSVFDLDLLQARAPVVLPSDYVQSIGVASNAIFAMVRHADGTPPGLDQIGMFTRTATALPTLGVWENKLAQDTVLASSSNGSKILVAGSDGSVMIYDASAGTFTISRKDFASLGGSYAASNFNEFAAGNNLLDSSGVAKATLSTATGTASGFAFFDPAQSGYFTTSQNSSAPGVIAQVTLANGTLIQPTPMVEAPILGATGGGTGSTPTSNQTTTCATASASCTAPLFTPSVNTVWTRSLAPMPDQSEIVSLTTSGFTVLPWSYATALATPQVAAIVSAADSVSPAASGGLVSIYGSQLSPANLANTQIPVPTTLGNSCVTVNGQPMPMIFVSPNQINAQMPVEAAGAVTVNVNTPGGASANYNLTVQPTAPAVFLSGVAGPQNNVPTVVRTENNLLATNSNPVHIGDILTLYLTGCGQTTPPVADGMAAPTNPLALTLTQPTVTLGGSNLSILYSGLAPGQVGVCQINATVPQGAPSGLNIPLTVTQNGSAQTVNVRVID
ncbi:MAG: IPT/TIG domain-containing protein, partial [Bryobacteraceae bacterium]